MPVSMHERLASIAKPLRERLRLLEKVSDEVPLSAEDNQEANEIRASLQQVDRLLEEDESRRDANERDWLQRRGLSQPGDLADGRPATFDDGARFEQLDGRRSGGMVGFTPNGEPVRLLRNDEQLSDPRKAEECTGKLGAIVRGLGTGDWSGLERLASQQSGYTPTEGGILLDRQISSRVIDLARAKARVMQAGAITVPMETRKLLIAKVSSEPSAGWRGEGKSISTGKVEFAGIELEARSLAVIGRMPIELAEDALNVGATVENSLSELLGLELDRVALVGTGAAEEPLGIENTDGINTVTGVGLPTNYDEFSSAVQKVWEANGEPNAVLLAPRDAGTLDRLKDSQNQPLQPPKSWQDLTKLPTNQCPTDRGAGSNESLSFVGDWAQLWIGTRTQIRIETSRHAGFQTNELYIRAQLRGDIAVIRSDHFTVLSGITTS